MNEKTRQPRDDEDAHRPLPQAAADPRARSPLAASDGDLYRLLIERSVEGIAILQDGRAAFANPRVTEMLGHSFEELASKPFEAFVAPEDREVAVERYEMRIAGEVAPSRYELTLVDRNGGRRRMELTAVMMTYRGRPADLVLLRDITEQAEVEHRARLVAQRIRQLHEVAADLTACVTEEEVCRVAIRAAEEILSLSICTLDLVEGDRLVVKAISSRAPRGASESRPIEQGGLAAKTLRTGKSYVFAALDEEPDAKPTQDSFKSGLSVPVGDLGVLQAASSENGAFSDEDVRVLEILARHTAAALMRIRLERELRWQAIHDPLTGVYNRRFAREAIERELARCLRHGHALVLLMVDVNRFKEINDRFGHQTGDRILQGVADVLQSEVWETASVIRYGGDEFLILMPEGEAEVSALGEHLQRAVTRWSRSVAPIDFPITLAVGPARYDPVEGGTWEDVLHLADRRMYEDKRSVDCGPGPDGMPPSVPRNSPRPMDSDA
jgi:diguanylate cyclase (GGDEF)-like protein/PAS domain S-box-containing protein